MNISGPETSSASFVSTSLLPETVQPGFQHSNAIFWTLLTLLHNIFELY